MKNCVKKIVVLCLALALATSLVACGAAGSATASTTALDRIKESGKIVVGCDPAIETVCFQDTASGEMVGMIPDLINGWAEQMGVTVQWETLGWDAMISAVNTGKVDIVAADMNRTIARAMNVTFCDPWMVDAPMALTLTDNTDYNTWEDLKKPGTKFGEVAGSWYETLLPELYPDCEVVTIAAGSWIDSLKSGIIDVNYNGTISGGQMLLNNPGQFKVIPNDGTVDAARYSFCVAQGDNPLADCFNIYLSEIKCSGRYAEIYKTWIGMDWEPDATPVAY